MKLYVSFGQSHAHRVNGNTFDCNSLCEIECSDYEDGRAKAFEAFEGVFGTTYTEDQMRKNLHFFPDGIKQLERSP